MRIISPFKDYYDIGMGLSYSPEPLFIRNPQEIKEKIHSRYRYNLEDSDSVQVDQILIYFCGQYYRGIRLKKVDSAASSIYYNINDIDKFVEKNLSKRDVDIYYDGKSSCHFRSIYNKLYRERCKSLLSIPTNRCFAEIYTSNPIVIEDSNRIEYVYINVKIANYDFFKVKNAYQAYQDIEMFLSNLASPEKPIPIIDDVTMANIKGFDKFSFRKDKVNK